MRQVDSASAIRYGTSSIVPTTRTQSFIVARRRARVENAPRQRDHDAENRGPEHDLSHAAFVGRHGKQRRRQTERQEKCRRDLWHEQGVTEERADEEGRKTGGHRAGVDDGVGRGRRLPGPPAGHRQNQPQEREQRGYPQFPEDLQEIVVRVLPVGRKALELGILVSDVVPGEPIESSRSPRQRPDGRGSCRTPAATSPVESPPRDRARRARTG